MAKDGSWTMYVKVEPYVPSYVAAVTGTWAENPDGSVTLTVSGGDYKDSLKSTFSFLKENDGVYSGSLQFTADAANGIVFSFNFRSVDIGSTSDVSVKPQSNSGNSAVQNPAPAKPAEKGELYRTPVYHGIYSGIVGDAYITFMDVDAPHAETGLTGKVFAVYVAAGEGYSPWITGHWALDESGKKLTMTPQKGSGEAGLTGSQAGEAKTYTADGNGVFHIDAYFPSGGTASFTLNPARDKVSSGSSQTQKPPVQDQPDTPDTPDTPDVPDEPVQEGDIVLTASDSIYDGAVTCDAVLTLKADGTWNMTTTVYGSTIENAVTGTWAKSEGEAITLTVKSQVTGAEMESPAKLDYDDSTGKYSGTVNLLCSGQFAFTLNFNGGSSGGEEIVKVTGISLDKNFLELTVGDTYQLTAVLSPSNATDKVIRWTSGDDSVATVENGKVTAVSAGETNITAISSDGGYTAACKVTVKEKAAESESYEAESDDRCNGFPMSLIFTDGSFHLNVDTIFFDASDWFKGTYSFNASRTELTLTTAYNPNGPHLAAAEADGSDTVTLTSQDGTFTIVVKDPSASSVNGTFTLKVETVEIPDEPEIPDTPAANIQLTLTAADTLEVNGVEITANAKLALYDDGTFILSVDPGQGYSQAAKGTWALDEAYNMVLTVTEMAVSESLPETFTLQVDYTTFLYSGTVEFAASPYTTFTFSFGSTSEEEPGEESITLYANDSIYDGAVTYDAVLYVNPDGTWSMDLTVYGNPVANAVSGTYSKGEGGSIQLTVLDAFEGAELESPFTLTGDSSGQYSGTANLSCMGQFEFTLNFT